MRSARDSNQQTRKLFSESEEREEPEPKTVKHRDAKSRLNFSNQSEKIFSQKSKDDVQIIFVKSEVQNEAKETEGCTGGPSKGSPGSVIDEDFFDKKKLVESETEGRGASAIIESQSEGKSLNLQVISLPNSKYFIERPGGAPKKKIPGSTSQIPMGKKGAHSFFVDRETEAKSREKNE